MSTHTFTIPEEWQPLIDREVTDGHYATTADVLREALQQWLERREATAALGEALNDVKAGRVRPWEDFVSDFRARNSIANSAT